MIITEEDRGLCMFPDLRDNSTDLSVVDRLSIVTFCVIGLLLSIFAVNVQNTQFISHGMTS